MKKIKAVIFDLDGTLLDSLCDLHLSVNASCEAHGFPTHTKDEVCSYVGDGVYKLIERAIPDGDKNEKFASTLAFFKEHYAIHMYDHTGAYEGIYEALDTLMADGYKLAVVSNKFDLAVKELCTKYFPEHIEVAIGECEAEGIKKKPAPDTVIAAMRQLCVTPDECIYVGDSDVDVQTARNSGMPCISVLWGFRPRDFLESVGADIFASSSSELIARINEQG